jgi:hypothetical protein
VSLRESSWVRSALTLVGGTVAGAVASAIVVQLMKNRAAPPAGPDQAATAGESRGAREAVPALYSRAGTKEAQPVDHKRDHERAILRHRDTVMAPEWAEKTSEAIHKGLREAQPQGEFEIIDVDCRSSSCLATLDWPSYNVAFRQWSHVVGHGYGIPCGASVYLDEPADRGAKYRGVVVFECSSRTGQGSK